MKRLFQALTFVAALAIPSIASSQTTTIGQHRYNWDTGYFGPAEDQTWGMLFTAPGGGYNNLADFTFFMYGGQAEGGGYPVDDADFQFSMFVYNWTDGSGLGSFLGSTSGHVAPTNDCGDVNFRGCAMNSGPLNVPIVGGQHYFIGYSLPSGSGALHHLLAWDALGGPSVSPHDGLSYAYSGADVGANLGTGLVCMGDINSCQTNGMGYPSGFDFINSDMTFDATITTTPEPGSILLLATGLLGLGAMARRKKSPAAE